MFYPKPVAALRRRGQDADELRRAFRWLSG
jgi:hypothetical protein